MSGPVTSGLESTISRPLKRQSKLVGSKIAADVIMPPQKANNYPYISILGLVGGILSIALRMPRSRPGISVLTLVRVWNQAGQSCPAARHGRFGACAEVIFTASQVTRRTELGKIAASPGSGLVLSRRDMSYMQESDFH